MVDLDSQPEEQGSYHGSNNPDRVNKHDKKHGTNRS